MPSFRIFGSPASPSGPAGAPRDEPEPAGSATRYARPARQTEELTTGAPANTADTSGAPGGWTAEPGWSWEPDPPTDPQGFAAVGVVPLRPQGAAGPGSRPWQPVLPGRQDAAAASPAPEAPPAWPTPEQPAWPALPVPEPSAARPVPEPGAPAAAPATPAPTEAARPRPDPAEAASLAAAFAADYLSWDEDDPDRRAAVLGEYLAERHPAQLGWSGRGRQRADFALPGAVRPDGPDRLLVNVRVRVTPYRAVAERRPAPDPLDDVAGVGRSAAAPAPTARGWRSMAAQWIQLSVAIAVDGDRLVVDAEEQLEAAPGERR